MAMRAEYAGLRGCGPAECQLGLAGESDARDLLQVFDEADFIPVRKKGCESVALALSDFQCDKAVWPECREGLRDEAAINIEAAAAGEECGLWLEVTDLGVKAVAVCNRDVGWVRDDGVEGGVAWHECAEQVRLHEADAAGELMTSRVGGSDFERVG